MPRPKLGRESFSIGRKIFSVTVHDTQRKEHPPGTVRFTRKGHEARHVAFDVLGQLDSIREAVASGTTSGTIGCYEWKKDE